ncbi:hypothetical protein PDIG_69830 [Penicillium digitatum PHI26]|uniref:Uncharacterized protein n=2 Tax=Penicillium digitatum TaxID=36651 RepID=K9FZY2_PEND2|nr:hypothetical protein PDIP_79120 [Penicillium digitatum Pd1]EKV06470.1 hypothetical protein PDIP_79120 [Penicillium digitatum Pd1]EKV08218.1 hypothetical protein PDIG_69830 [Penicillium digitatum PHI26]
MGFPADHPGWLGLRHSGHEAMGTSGVILVVDCDVLWVPTQDKPSASAKIFHLDVDPLKQQIPVFHSIDGYIPCRCFHSAQANQRRFLGSKESITMDQWRDEEHSKP